MRSRSVSWLLLAVPIVALLTIAALLFEPRRATEGTAPEPTASDPAESDPEPDAASAVLVESDGSLGIEPAIASPLREVVADPVAETALRPATGPRRYTLEGRVVGQNRRPAASVPVHLVIEGVSLFSESLTLGAVATTITDEQGEYRFADLAVARMSGRYVVASVSRGKFEYGRVQVESTQLASKHRLADLFLRSGGRIAGRVVDEYGMALIGARLHFHCDPMREVVSDGAGGFDSGPLPIGTCLVRSSLVGYASAGPYSCEVMPNSVTELRVRMRRGSTLSGVIVDSRGRSLPNATVEVERDGKRRPVDETGRFAFDDLPAGKATVSFRAPGCTETTRKDLVIPAVGIVVELRSNWTVEGTAVRANDGSPVHLRQVRVERCKGGTSMAWSRSNARRLEFSSASLPWLSQRMVTGRYPAVQIGPELDSLESAVEAPFVAATASQAGAILEVNGRFRIHGSMDGIVLVIGIDDGGATAVAGPFAVARATNLTDARLEFAPGRELRVRVRDSATGEPLLGALVRASPPNEEFGSSVATDERGEVTLTELTGNFVEVRVIKPGYANQDRKCRVSRVGESLLEQFELKNSARANVPRDGKAR